MLRLSGQLSLRSTGAALRQASLLRLGQRNFSTQERLFDKILIANRGEIACRVMRTCKKLGIKTVAVYSDVDRQSVHVRMADEAVCVGPAPSTQSYLNIDAIVDAAKKTKAQAVHPGYGFLSEKVKFCDELEKNGVVFIGPKHDAITKMGDKISAKTIARNAKVSTVPGFVGILKDAEEAVKVANQIGYPVMIKASQGGGGKGMRIARNDAEAREGYRLSLNEAKSSFNSDALFVEKYIEEPRHIEVQVLADSFGDAVYLYERECSIQRRNQKVIEEAPSTFLDDKTRRAMGEQAVAMAKAVGYQSAGTCEFLVDKHRNFYFLEMNTRLQVEHPISELITGVDLVEQMIRVAAKKPLPWKQSEIPLKGWALEARVYAEDPLRGFLPSIGRLQKYIEPKGEGVRCDSGIEEGADISIYYDPMICKLITYGPNRNDALVKMRAALDSYVIRGVTHNINFLRSLCDHPRFIKGDINTAFIPQEYPQGYKGHELTIKDKQVLLSGALVLFSRTIAQQVKIEGRLGSFHQMDFVRNKLKEVTIEVGGETFAATVSVDRDGALVVKLADDKQSIRVESGYTYGDLVFDVILNGEKTRLQVIKGSEGLGKFAIQLNGTSFPVTVLTKKQGELMEHMPVPPEVDFGKLVVSPMPGAVFSINVQVGESVIPGQEVCVIEAMKMQNVLRAANAGKVKAINVKPGATVARDQVLVELE